jgi:hypothetical protein
MTLKDDELFVEIDGPGVAPATVDPVGILSIAASYFALLQELADDQGIELKLTGLEVRDKCAAVVCRTSDRGAAWELTGRVAAYVSGMSEWPKGYRGGIETLRKAIQRLPAHQKARVVVGADWEIPLSAHDAGDGVPPYETIHRRARPIRVGGKVPAVRFESGSEEHPFTLETSRENAQAIAGYLYQDLDIVARIRRGPDGRISGELIAFEPLEDGDATTAWRSWYRENAGEEHSNSIFDEPGAGDHVEG